MSARLVVAFALLYLSFASGCGIVRVKTSNGEGTPTSTSTSADGRRQPTTIPATWSPEPGMTFYEQRFAEDGYSEKVLERRNFAPDDTLALKAFLGECYKLVVLRETRLRTARGWEGGVTPRGGAWASWGPDRSLDHAAGDPRLEDGYGASVMDLGCFLASGDPAGTTKQISLNLDDDQQDWTPGVAPAFYVRVYKKVIGRERAMQMWKEKFEGIKRHAADVDVLAGQCRRVQERFAACTSGKRPSDYPKGASCREAATAERRDIRQGESCPLN
jgi:hypothetical protein